MQRITPEMTTKARALRRNATAAERVLWRRLSPTRPRFTRQLTIDRFIVDLACRSVKLAVELDGSQHLASVEKDCARTAYLERCGWSVIRFWNRDVLGDPDAIADAILAEVARLATHPRPLP